MIAQKVSYFVVVVLVAIVLAACDQIPAAKSPTSLTQALAYAPATTTNMTFTDWVLLKRYMKLESLSAKRTESELRELLDKIDSQAPVAFGSQTTLGSEKQHIEIWGWDFTDLTWEAELSGEFSPLVHVLKLRDGFDFTPVTALYKERGFDESEYGGAKIYSRSIGTELAEWEYLASGLGIYNTALLPDKGILIFSNSNDSVRSTLDVLSKGDAASLAGNKAIREMVEAMGEVGSVTIIPGDLGCKRLSGDTVDNPALKELLSKVAKAHAYDAFAQGYRYEGEEAVAWFAMHYASPDTAKADVEIRRANLAEGQSLAVDRGSSYTELIEGRNGVSQVEANGSTLFVKVRGKSIKSDFDGKERNVIPELLFLMSVQADMTFALCP